MDQDLQVFCGDAVKALDDSGRVGGYLVKFSSGKEKDLHGEYFDAKGYYGPADGDGAEALFEHGFPIVAENAPPATKQFHASLADHTFAPLKTRRDDIGIWAETVLDLANDYEKRVHALVKTGKIGWSSGAPGHRVKVDADGRITRWPIAEGSLTPRPANPQSRAVALKSWCAERTESMTLPQSDGLFERELAAQKNTVPDLWSTFYKCVGEIARAASTADVTGVPVDINGLLAGAANGFVKSLVPVIEEQINSHLSRPTEQPFYLKGGQDARLRALLTDGDVAFRDSLTDHSKAVASAVEEFAELSTALAKSIADYAGRTERKAAFRVKEGRMLSTANLDLMEASCGRLDGAATELKGIGESLMGLVERARKPMEETKAADEKALALRAKWMRMQAAELGIECAA